MYDLFHTYCHECRNKAHCQPLTWKDEQGKWNVRLLCSDCWQRCKKAMGAN